jgi:hypothetical protein
MDPYLVEGYAVAATDVIENKRVRKLRAQQELQELQEQPKIQAVEPQGRYTIISEKARENNRALRELDELEQKVLEKAAVIGVVKKLRESNAYLEFDPKLTGVTATIPATGDTFLTRQYPKLSENEERALDQAFEYLEGFRKYGEMIDPLLEKDKLTNAESEMLDNYARYAVEAKKARQLIATLSAKKYR